MGLATVLALAATACDSGDSASTGPSAQSGGVFRVPIGEPRAIDPYNARESEGNSVTRRLFVGLVTYDGNPELVMRPGVAERWSATGIQGYGELHGDPQTATTFSGQSAPDPSTLQVRLSSSD